MTDSEVLLLTLRELESERAELRKKQVKLALHIDMLKKHLSQNYWPEYQNFRKNNNDWDHELRSLRLSKMSYNALRRAALDGAFSTINELAVLVKEKPEQLFSLRNFGSKSFSALEEALINHGYI